jgi:plastocyanin
MRQTWRKTALLLVMALPGLLPLGCGPGPGGADGGTEPRGTVASPEGTAEAPPAAERQIVIDNFSFQPAEVTVAAGTKVTWLNRDDVPHTATSTARPKAFDSGTLDTDEKFSRVFAEPGTYEYFCAVHPKMTGRVIVK